MSNWTHQYELGDPARVLERRESSAHRQASKAIRKAAARQGIESLFEGDDMGRKISIPGNILDAMYCWGVWARRPQFWVNLGPTPFYRLLPIPRSGKPIGEIRLDPLSHHIHRAVMRIDSDLTRAVLYVYFVRESDYKDHADLLTRYGVTYARFIELLKHGSHEAYARGKRTLDAQQKIYNSISS